MRVDRRLKSLKTILWSISIIAVGCSPAIQSSNSNVNKGYSEDISAHRPVYEEIKKDTLQNEITEAVTYAFNPQYDVTDTLNALLDSISVLSKQITFVDGYAIQVYSGNNREEANTVRGKAYAVIKSERPSLFYDSPNFKVQVGQFYSELDANETYGLLKKEFPNAILVLRKFKIERE